MLRIAKDQVHRSLAAFGYKLALLEPEKPPPPFLSDLERISAETGLPIPPKMLQADYPGREDIPLYIKRYGANALLDRRFYNIGAAWNRHACWTNVDHPSAWYAADQKDNLDLPWDISLLQPIGVESGTAEAVYSSHTVEHLLDQHVEHMFREAHRILKPDGFLRVTCPDMTVYYEVYKRREDDLWHYASARPKFSHQDLLLHEFASQLSDIMRAGNPPGGSNIKIPDSEVDRIFASLPFDQACNHFTAMLDYELHKVTPGAHINWWTHDKVEAFMRRAGFTKIRRSSHKQSMCVAMRGAQFDTTHASFSLYIEAER